MVTSIPNWIEKPPRALPSITPSPSCGSAHSESKSRWSSRDSSLSGGWRIRLIVSKSSRPTSFTRGRPPWMTKAHEPIVAATGIRQKYLR